MLEHVWAETECPPYLPYYKNCTSGTLVYIYCRHTGLSTCGTHWGKEKCIRGLGGMAKGKTALGRPGPRWMNTETYLKLRTWSVSTSLTSGKAAGSCKYYNEPSGSTKCGEFLTCAIICRMPTLHQES